MIDAMYLRTLCRIRVLLIKLIRYDGRQACLLQGLPEYSLVQLSIADRISRHEWTTPGCAEGRTRAVNHRWISCIAWAHICRRCGSQRWHCDRLLLIEVGAPYDGSMCSKCEQKADHIGGKEEYSCSPAIRSNCTGEKLVVDGGNLAEVALPTVVGRAIIRRSTRPADELMAAIYFVEERRSESRNDGEEQQGRSSRRRLHIETLCLPLDSTEAHRQAGQKQYTCEDASNNTSFHKGAFAFVESNTVQVNFDDG